MDEVSQGHVEAICNLVRVVVYRPCRLRHVTPSSTPSLNYYHNYQVSGEQPGSPALLVNCNNYRYNCNWRDSRLQLQDNSWRGYRADLQPRPRGPPRQPPRHLRLHLHLHPPRRRQTPQTLSSYWQAFSAWTPPVHPKGLSSAPPYCEVYCWLRWDLLRRCKSSRHPCRVRLRRLPVPLPLCLLRRAQSPYRVKRPPVLRLHPATHLKAGRGPLPIELCPFVRYCSLFNFIYVRRRSLDGFYDLRSFVEGSRR